MKTSVIFLSLLIMTTNSASDFLGPAHVTLQRFDKCAEDALGYQLNMTLHKINRTHQGVDVDIKLPVDSDDDVKFNATISKWGDGGWKPHMLDYYAPNTCEFFKKYAEKDFHFFLENFKVPQKCPVASGEYHVKNFVYEGNLKVPMMYGDFKIEFRLTWKDQLLTCKLIYVKSEPKKTI